MWRIAAPLILSNISVPLLGMVDAGVLGHLDSAGYLAGVSLAGAVFSLIFMGMNFLRMGTTGMTAQAFGRNDGDALRETLGQGLICALGIAAALILLRQPIGTLAWQLMAADADTTAAAAIYFDIRILGAPFTLINYVLIGWFIGVKDGRSPLLLVLTSNSVNIVLDLLLVNGLGWRSDGVALASVVAEASGNVVGLWLVARKLNTIPGQWQQRALTTIRAYRGFFAVNANIFVRTMALIGTLSFITSQGVRFGQAVIAANAILMNLFYVLSYALDGLAQAAEALVGEAWGARNRRALRDAVRASLIWSLATAGLFVIVFAAGGPLLIDLLTSIDTVRINAREYLPWMIVAPLICVWSFLFDGVFVGTTWAREMRNVMVVSAIVVFVPTWWLSYALGNHGLWLSFTAFMTARASGMALIYRRRINQPPITDWPANAAAR
ncbi:MAG: MATE family efflux transporter [Pseudomonadota bacterium]